MPKAIQMKGKKFGRLTVLEMIGEKTLGRHPKWLCLCDCGKKSTKSATALRHGKNPSCGCAIKEFQRQKNNLAGQKFGRLLAVSALPESNIKRHILWKCICDCGSEHIAVSYDLKSGHTKSCGCLYKESRYQNIIHGHARATGFSPTYVSWYSMITRCKNKNATNYKHYGEIGVTVCERWLEFKNFLSDMGERPEGMTIDRINPHGNYEPSNCRWADWLTQQSNKRAKNEKRMVEGN